ncbi:MAG TPA: GPI anchored serine-threonine rich family protein, partial [Anaerolineae bacterium]
GPHLHLELYDPGNNLIDPYQGSCNQLNARSWWAGQRPYFDSAVNKVTTGDSAPVLPNCPGQDVSNIEDSFAPGALVYFTTYYRDQLSSQQSRYSIYRPDGTVYQSWTHSINETHFAASWWWWSYYMPGGPAGTWRFRVEFNGQSYETYFNVGDPAQITISAPAGGQFLAPGSNHTITWSDNVGGNVRIDLYQNGQYKSTLATSTPSDGAYQWTAPVNPDGPFGYQIRIVNLPNEAVYADSDHFAIGDPAQFNYLFLPAVLKQ